MAMTRAVATALACLSLATPLLLTACGSDAPPPNYAPLSYAYLKPLRINAGTVDVDPTPPDLVPGDISTQSPAVPLDVLQQMAHDRLVPAGASGRAVFHVEQASIVNAGGVLSGLFRVRVDVFTSDGQRAAYAQAAVARTTPAPDDDAMRGALYDLTKQMMADMNIELEYQLRRSLGDWLESSDAVAPPPAPVQQQSLAPPDPNAPATSLPPVAPGQQPTRYQLVPTPPPNFNPPTQ